jgi:hypothetical protein
MTKCTTFEKKKQWKLGHGENFKNNIAKKKEKRTYLFENVLFSKFVY